MERFRLTNLIRPTRWRNEVRGVEFESSNPGTGRIETGVAEGGEISSFYDPMIAKLICHAPDRRAAALGLFHIVADAEIWPLKTNATFLHALLVNPDFMRGDVHTGFIETHQEDVIFEMDPPQWLLDPVAEALIEAWDVPMAQGFRLKCA